MNELWCNAVIVYCRCVRPYFLLSSMSCWTVRCTTAAASVSRGRQVSRPRAVGGTWHGRRAAAPTDRCRFHAVVTRVTASRRPRRPVMVVPRGRRRRRTWRRVVGIGDASVTGRRLHRRWWRRGTRARGRPTIGGRGPRWRHRACSSCTCGWLETIGRHIPAPTALQFGVAETVDVRITEHYEAISRLERQLVLQLFSVNSSSGKCYVSAELTREHRPRPRWIRSRSWVRIRMTS